MKKTFFALLIGLLSFISLSSSHAMQTEKTEEETNKNLSVKALKVDDDLLEIIKKLQEKTLNLENENKILQGKVLYHDKILEENPSHRRKLRVGPEIWVSFALGITYYLATYDLSTSLAIVSYGISILFVLWSLTHKHDDTFHAMTRTKESKKDEK